MGTSGRWPMLLLAGILVGWVLFQVIGRSGPLPPLPDPDAWRDYSPQGIQPRPGQRPVLVLTTGESWCAPCIRLRREVLTDPEMEAFLARHVDRIRIEQPPRHDADRRGLADLPTRSFPTLRLFLPGPDGPRLHIREGFMSSKTIKTWITWALENPEAPDTQPMLLPGGRF
ncbi:MAG: hypothetical protein JJU36_13065 [Phycisphaeraceae bacterium]|nr:hypothetical protein [Phycisphaeraceae bacterium]